jgi:hypothetical protein
VWGLCQCDLGVLDLSGHLVEHDVEGAGVCTCAVATFHREGDMKVIATAGRGDVPPTAAQAHELFCGDRLIGVDGESDPVVGHLG